MRKSLPELEQDCHPTDKVLLLKLRELTENDYRRRNIELLQHVYIRLLELSPAREHIHTHRVVIDKLTLSFKKRIEWADKLEDNNPMKAQILTQARLERSASVHIIHMYRILINTHCTIAKFQSRIDEFLLLTDEYQENLRKQFDRVRTTKEQKYVRLKDIIHKQKLMSAEMYRETKKFQQHQLTILQRLDNTIEFNLEVTPEKAKSIVQALSK